MFEALQHRNFRLLWLGQLISFSGSMMQQAAILWHVSLLVPADRRRLMMATQISAALVAAALAALSFAGITEVWPVYLLAALGAAAGAFDTPARQALIPSLVPRAHLANALSLNQIMFQSASVIGPSIGGVLIASPGIGWAYLFNAISFLFVLLALVRMRNVPTIDAQDR